MEKCEGIAVSIIVPMYNCAAFIPELMPVLTEQTLKNIEIICVDDGSKDDTYQLLQEYAREDARIRVLREENAGAGCARNLGMENARGKYMMFLDADDVYSTELVEKLYRCAEENRADLVGCDYIGKNLRMGTESTVKCFKNVPEEEVFCFRDLVKQGRDVYASVVPMNKLYRREKVLANGERFDALRCANDVFFVKVQVFVADRIVYLPVADWITVRTYISDDSITSNRLAHLEDSAVARQNLYNWLIKQPWYDAYVLWYWMLVVRRSINYNSGFGESAAFTAGVESILDLPVWVGLSAEDVKKILDLRTKPLKKKIAALESKHEKTQGEINRLNFMKNQLMNKEIFCAYIDAHHRECDDIFAPLATLSLPAAREIKEIARMKGVISDKDTGKETHKFEQMKQKCKKLIKKAKRKLKRVPQKIKKWIKNDESAANANKPDKEKM